ncbi:MAG: DUF4173 domain-containing protein [bacterium]
MPHDWVIHGVPMAIECDGWWLVDPPGDGLGRPGRLNRRRSAALVLLVAAADLLFYRQTLGLSLAVFGLAVFAATSTHRPRPAALLVLVLSLLPVVDYVQPLSLAILLLGLPAALVLNQPAPLITTLALLAALPCRGVRDAWTGLRRLQPGLLPARTARQWLAAWAFPVGGTLVLLALLAAANPVLEDWLSWLTNLPLDPVEIALRASFWLGMALLLWPLLDPPPEPLRLGKLTLPASGLNAASVTRALILFNLLLGLQTLLDARYLWTGTAPHAMTLATYAHRGAYPLLATALLAGAFALAARPWVAERPMLKRLLLLWLAQNVLLTLSALYRLDLYVTAFGLTYLRIHAAIWMALVAAGLALTLTQIAAVRSNGWLLIRCTGLGLTTLYFCAFINFAGLIAQVNIAENKIDTGYLCALGPTAAAALPPLIPPEPAGRDPAVTCTFRRPEILGWRDWGFRNWLVLHNLHVQEAAHEDPRRG